MLAILAAFLSHASAGEVTVSLRGPASYVQPGAAALVIETLAHVDRQKYCRLIADLANEPLSNGSDVVADLLKRSGVTDVQADAIWLSLGFNEFGPAAAQNFTTSRARCGPSNGRKVATDFLSPFDYEPGMQVQYLAPEPTGDILMTGFGGSLDLKRTDYLVIDDDGSAGKIRDDSNMLERLTAKEIGNIGLRAVSHIINADDPMAAFVDVSQNFPPGLVTC
ncbi:killer toxin resistant protein [Savitreella phatthalungensis]